MHLHHDNDTEANFRTSVARFRDLLHARHGALPRDPATGELRFGFIHGNWCLDNSRADGRWCGINNELVLLRELGCYADFTLPSAPSDTQTRTVNAIYYATDDPLRPRSHDHGVPVRAGGQPSGDLMIVQGPLALNWAQRRAGIVPRIENSDVRAANPPTPSRVDAWVRAGIHVAGRPEWVFVKVHTHGTQERDMDTLLGDTMHAMHDHLERSYNDGKRYVLHYVQRARGLQHHQGRRGRQVRRSRRVARLRPAAAAAARDGAGGIRGDRLMRARGAAMPGLHRIATAAPRR